MIFTLIISFILGILLGFLMFRRRKVIIRYSGENISEIARALAHEVRNPLNTIRMNLQLMQEEIGAEEHYAQRLSLMEGELLRLDRILKSFLNYSRLPTPQFVRVDLSDTIMRIIDIIRARSVDVEIEAHLAENLPKINADPALLAEVLHNVIQNAIDSSDEGKTVIVETSRTSGGVSIAITDRGKGIPPEMLNKIFMPYFSTKSGGIGIGMAVVKRIVEAHSGKIQVQSRVGSGTRIIIELPAM